MSNEAFLMGVAGVIVLAMALALVRCVKGPTMFDRILAANVFGTITVVLIAMLSFVTQDLAYVDIALLYALVNFVTTIGYLKYFKDRSFKKG